jgi:integrase
MRAGRRRSATTRRALLDAPDPATLKGLRDRALLSVLLYHGLRREELCLLTVRDIHDRHGVPHLRVHGKGGKTRYLPLHPGSAERIHAYLDAAGHGGESAAPLFQPVKRRQGTPPRRGDLGRWRLQMRARVCGAGEDRDRRLRRAQPARDRRDQRARA